MFSCQGATCSAATLICWAELLLRLLDGEGARMKTLTRVVFLGSIMAVPALLHGATGCVNSPECPTAILGVVGAAGAALYVRWRAR